MSTAASRSRSGPAAAGLAASAPSRSAVPRPGERLALAALVLGFLALSLAWLAVDERVPDFDSGKHLLFGWAMHDALAGGDLLAPLEVWTAYPPLVHLVTGASALVAGIGVDAAVFAQALVFVPLLAVGCYGTARVAYGPGAGILAAVFALAAPMVLSLFHLHMLDAPQAALVAVTVWLALASDRFRRVPLAALAGLAAGLGMLAKQTFPLFVAGLLLVMLLRGGWRRPRGLLAFCLVLALVALPWYLAHLDDLRGLVAGATGAPGPVGGGPANGEQPGSVTPPRWSTQNAGWYVWNALNVQLLAPLTALFVVGGVALSLRWLRRRRPEDLTPELVAGGLVAYLALTYLSLKDPRYSLPAIVYMAALGVGGITALAPRPRRILTAALLVVAALNVVGTWTGVGERVALVLPGAPRSSLGERELTLFLPGGYIAGRPVPDGEVLAMMRAARGDGVRSIEFDPGANALSINAAGLQALARVAGLARPPVYDPASLGPDAAFLLVRLPAPGAPPPCASLEDGRQVYLVLGSPLAPFEQLRLYCPLRRPALYGAG
ncbi:MAG: glycosyltransferase family 39 protein [Actinomycetota bacterium]|nr:glycosyltransferase family 39 protein [Actinomycetota bacterium]